MKQMNEMASVKAVKPMISSWVVVGPLLSGVLIERFLDA